jgi:hypothetical protein
MNILEKKLDNQQDVYPTKLSRVYVNSGGDYMIMLEGMNRYLTMGKAGNPIADVLYKTALEAIVTGQSNLWVRYWPCVPESNCSKYVMGSVGIIEFH